MPLTSTGRKIQTQWFYFSMVSIYSTDWEQSSLWLEVKSWKNASDFHGEKNSNSMVLLLDGLKGCQIIRHASLQLPQPTKQTIPQSIVLIGNKVASGWKWKAGKMPLTGTGRKIQTQWFYFAMVSKAARLSGMHPSNFPNPQNKPFLNL